MCLLDLATHRSPLCPVRVGLGSGWAGTCRRGGLRSTWGGPLRKFPSFSSLASRQLRTELKRKKGLSSPPRSASHAFRQIQTSFWVLPTGTPSRSWEPPLPRFANHGNPQSGILAGWFRSHRQGTIVRRLWDTHHAECGGVRLRGILRSTRLPVRFSLFHLYILSASA